jgi:hypothetical protein
MLLRFPITLVLSFVCLVIPAWADFEAGVDAYNRGDYATALREWRSLAERGNASAQFNLGALYSKEPRPPGGAFVNQEGSYLRFATGCHSSPLFRAGHSGRSS